MNRDIFLDTGLTSWDLVMRFSRTNDITEIQAMSHV